MAGGRLPSTDEGKWWVRWSKAFGPFISGTPERVATTAHPLSVHPTDFSVPAIPGSLAAKILEILNPRKGICAKTIATQLNKSVKTIRNELTSLRNLGLLVAEKLRYVTYYELARIKK